MPDLAALAGLALGIGIGLHFARLLAAVTRDSHGSQQILAAYKEVFGYCLGAVLGSASFGYLKSAEAGTLYVLGYGLGSTIAFFWPLLPANHTLESVRIVVAMSDALKDSTPDQGQRSLLILNTLVPPRAIQKSENLSEIQLADRLEKAADNVAAQTRPSEPHSPASGK